MPLKLLNRENVRPATVRDAYIINQRVNDDDEIINTYGVEKFISDSLSDLLHDEWYNFLCYFKLTNVSCINEYLVNTYGERVITPSIMDMFTGWCADDYIYLRREIQSRTSAILFKNREMYKRMFDAMTLSFNPLWNVDGTETTTRTLERDGTVTNAKTGKDTLKKTGTDTDTQSGTDTTTYSGRETTTRDGDITKTTSGGYTDTKAVTTTDSNTWLDSEKNTRNYNNSGEIENTQYANLTDSKVFANRQDSLQYGKVDTMLHNTQDEQSYASTNTETLDTVDTERITHERHGNIGVTKSTELIQSYWDTARYMDFVNRVCLDVLESFTMGVY